MSTVLQSVLFLDEVADFLAKQPSPDEVLAYRASDEVETRFQELLEKQRGGELSLEEREEMAHFQQTEMLLRLLKARLRRSKGTR